MWNFQQSLQPKQAAEGLMFLIHLIKRPAKMTHFKKNNKPCQIFNHNKESEGRPIYFFFYTPFTFQHDLNATPDACNLFQHQVISEETPSWLPSRTAHPGWWKSSLLAEAVDGSRLGAGLWSGCVLASVLPLCLCLGSRLLDCSSPTHSSKGKY